MNSRPRSSSSQPLISRPHPSAGGPSPAELLAKMPRKPMTAEQQLAALDKVQAQATQRIKLGQQLFKAAEARLTQHQEVLDKIRSQQQDLREQVQQDVAKSLQTYDQWMGQIDESFTGAIHEVTERLDKLEAEHAEVRSEMQSMVARAIALMEQTQQLLMEAFGDDAAPVDSPAPSPTPVPTPEPAVEPNELESAVINHYAAQEPEPADPEQAGNASESPSAEDAPPAPFAMSDSVMPIDDEQEEDDVFGQVLQRLRDADAEETLEDDQAAA